jgi:hypothetical protein
MVAIGGGRQHNNIADPIESSAIDTRTVAGAASRCNATVRKFATGKCGHTYGRY